MEYDVDDNEVNYMKKLSCLAVYAIILIFIYIGIRYGRY